jgi:hypothetical protein
MEGRLHRWVVIIPTSDTMSACDADPRAVELLARLLAAGAPEALEAFRHDQIDDPSVSIADLAVAQQLLRDIVDTLTLGGAARWQSLERALDTTLVTPPPSAISAAGVDTTLPVVTEPSVTEREPPTNANVDPDVDATLVIATEDHGEAATLRIRTGTKESGVPSVLTELDRYAVLCAWSEIHPERRPQLHRQFGLADEDDRAALDARMAAMFATDDELRAAFAQRLQMHLGHLRRG